MVDKAARHYLDSEGVEATFEPELDYADVLGQEVAKRGMALAAAGELGLLMIGSPGSGKTRLARRMRGVEETAPSQYFDRRPYRRRTPGAPG